MAFKADLWCAYCRGQDFIEHPRPGHENDPRYSEWECTNCHAIFEDNPGYGYFVSYWGDNPEASDTKYSSNTGEELNDSKLPRTPEGIMRHSSSREELEAYLDRTQIK